MPFTNDQVMFTLAGLTYRGFQDVLPGGLHAKAVRAAVADGLQTFSPVKDDWDLAWGPATHDDGLFDSSAMYVARHRHAPHRYVVAIRGTNPISAADWLLGDLLAWTTVGWPYATDGAAVSTSTALGIQRLLELHARPALPASRAAPGVGAGAFVRRVAGAMSGALPALFGRSAKARAAFDALLGKITPSWQAQGLMERLRARTGGPVAAVRLQRTVPRPDPGDAEMDLLTFLRREASRTSQALDVCFTGHSKGGALAPALALWLKDELSVAAPAERWDAGRGARLQCYAFAGPTPGNAAFAERIDKILADDHHHLRNMNDIVTHAWEKADLRSIPDLYGRRTAGFQPLVDAIVAGVETARYRQARSGVTTFNGALKAERPFVAEFIHQHLDAYLEHLALLGPEINALTFFV